jgi:hypothetical protein
MSAIHEAIQSGWCAFRSREGIRPARRTLAALLLLGATAGGAALLTVPPRTDGSPVAPADPYAIRAVPGEYVVIFGGGITGEATLPESPFKALLRRRAFRDREAAGAAAVAAGGTIQFRYGSALIGFSGNLPPAALKAVSKATSGRAYIEPSWTALQRPETGPTVAPDRGFDGEGRREAEARLEADGRLQPVARSGSAQLMKSSMLLQPAPLPQGLDRIGQRLLALNSVFNRPSGGNVKVDVYVIDSGILGSHSQFRVGTNGSRVVGSYNFTGSSPSQACFDHGTQVAGIAAGKTFGLAPAADLYSLRVIDCNHVVRTAWVIAAVDWLVQHKTTRPSIANMSLEFDVSSMASSYASQFLSMDAAIKNAINRGVIFVVAAGNDNKNACNISPARIRPAITVASTDPETDIRASSSNYGTCVDIFAPGVAIVSSASSGNDAWDMGFGTSSATPHVTGLAALLLSRGVTTASVWNTIVNAANVRSTAKTTPNWCGVADPRSAPNLLLHWGAAGSNGIVDGEPPGVHVKCS